MITSQYELESWNEKILELVDQYKLNCYPQEFEVCDHNEMIGYMAYTGMPSHYSHWSYGKSFEKQKTMYEYGVSGLPYEMVINTDPCVAYLMRDNTLLLHILTIAHVYGHNDFFANNFTFTSGTKAKYTLETFKNNASRIDSYMEDPSIGANAVEDLIEHAHSISYQVSKNLAIKKLSLEEQRQRKLDESIKQFEDPYKDIHPNKKYVAPDLSKIPLEPEENVLGFIAEYSPSLPEWKRDVLRIVENTARYFMPQMETKIMNEGWASYWHHKILNNLDIDQGLKIEFMIRHNQVLRPFPGGLNPYHLGFVVWHDIERRWNAGEHVGGKGPVAPQDEQTGDFQFQSIEAELKSPGRKKIFEVRETDRDSSFLRRFLTPEIMRELELFQHEKRGKDRLITKVADDENWSEVKETLIKNVGSGSVPIIKIEDADFGKNRTLYMKHYHDGRDLQIDYAEQTIRHVRALWERDVVLETIVGGKKTLVKIGMDNVVKVEKV